MKIQQVMWDALLDHGRNVWQKAKDVFARALKVAQDDAPRSLIWCGKFRKLIAYGRDLEVTWKARSIDSAN